MENILERYKKGFHHLMKSDIITHRIDRDKLYRFDSFYGRQFLVEMSDAFLNSLVLHHLRRIKLEKNNHFSLMLKEDDNKALRFYLLEIHYRIKNKITI